MSLAARSLKPIPKKKSAIKISFDPLLLVALVLITLFGLVMMFSASADFSHLVLDEEPTYLFKRQVLFLGIGIVAFILSAFIDYRIWKKFILYVLIFSIVMLLFVNFFGDTQNGAQRWMFSGSINPTEFAKLVLIMYLSVWVSSKKEKLSDAGYGVLVIGSWMGLIVALVMMQPDLSAAATIVIIGMMILFLAGGRIQHIMLFTLAIVIAGFVVIQFSSTGQRRMAEFAAGWANPYNASDQVKRGYQAFYDGGIFGVGVGNGTAKLTGLPVPHTDSIFAVVGEEVGILGIAGLLGLYGVIIWRGLKIAEESTDVLGRILSASLVLWLGLEAAINMAVMVGLMPFSGNALPFFSSGGSNLVVNLVAVGLVLNVSRVNKKKVNEAEERKQNAFTDLRRSERRRNLPRTQRTPGARRSSR